MKTKNQALLDWFHGRTDKPMPTPETDIGEAFLAGWDARNTDLKELRKVVDLQAEDKGLWFINPTTVREAYLQKELRSLHDRIEQLSP